MNLGEQFAILILRGDADFCVSVQCCPVLSQKNGSFSVFAECLKP